MRNTKVQAWVDAAARDGVPYLVVVCDTFDWTDYPVRCASREDADALVDDPGSMQRVMEVVDLARA